jgi:2,3-bisphosphoglycerate-dependent phosphoglycerate mutase
MKAGNRIIVVAHGHCLRSLVKQWSGMSEVDIISYRIPTGVPFVYEFDEEIKPINPMPEYLVDADELAFRLKQDNLLANEGKLLI